MAIGIYFLLVGIMLGVYMLPVLISARALNVAVSGFEQYRREAACYWALHGEWPTGEADLSQFRPVGDDVLKGGIVDQAKFENGAIHVYFKAVHDETILTCRPAVPKNNATGPVNWRCGPAYDDDSEWLIQGKDKTSLDTFFIPRELW